MSPTAVTPDQFSTFGELLRHLRRQARLTQRELAIAVGYSDTQISRMEQNQRVPDAATLTALFVPALYIEAEPIWVARLLELAKAAQVEDKSEAEVTPGLPTGTVTFLFTDIEGSTKLAREYPDALPTLLARHHEILKQCIQAHNGYVFQVVGDSFAAAFHSASDALNAALTAQRNLHNEPWSPAPIKVRMGIHTGTAHLQDASKVLRYSGYATLALTQRIMSAGHGGQILLSNATEALLRGQLPKQVNLHDIGEHKIKDVFQPMRIFQVIAPNLQQEFPPLRTIDSHPNNLPTQLTSFVGREKELVDVKKLLHNAHLLTLIGPGGTGKTRLSIQAASELLDHYPDGVWLVELAPILDPTLVPRTTAIEIGLRDEPQRPVIDMLCDYLHEKKMLLILDNCEHLVDACAQMANKILLAAPSARILASSREALGIAGEVTYRVPSLGLPDMNYLPSIETLSQYEAVKLFIDRATSAVQDFTVTNENAPFLAQICYRLDGIPLAIELAASKVRVLSLEQIARRLDDRFRLLTGGSRTALERHQTLRAAIDWSYNFLPPAEQVFFRRLSVFIGGWTLEAAESVCEGGSVKSEDVLNLSEQLINKSLVVMEEMQGETRYHMLETMRQYANEELVESGESDALRDKHLEYFLTLAETAAPHLIRPEELEWLPLLDADYENLRLALEWALSKEPAKPSLRLCTALGKFWAIRCYWIEGAKWLASALAKPVQNHDDAEKVARVRALCQDAALAELLDQLERMKTSAELGLKLAQEGSDQCDIAIARFYIGFALFRLGDYSKARPLIEQSSTEFQELNDPYWGAITHMWLGASQEWLDASQINEGELKLIEHGLRSLELARKAGERSHLVKALTEYSYLLFRYGRTDEARKHLEEAEKLSKQISSNTHPLTFLLAQFRLAQIEWLDGNRRQARALFMESQARLRLLGERLTSSQCIECLGLLSMEEGDLNQAQAYLEEALSIARELEIQYFIARRLAWLSILFYFQGNIEKSKQNFRESISLTKDLSPYAKAFFLESLFILPYFQMPENSVLLLGAIGSFLKQFDIPIEPFFKNYWVRAEVQARESLGETTFESTFVEGRKMTLDEALDLALKTAEKME